ncbi:hypothetical protein CEE45_13005 [Candidatus Heimdallarchaeota archaeon B3_Heim]|nr:MAG: hypothetical protein CEE45_13005 [Candidatus Heimdallarchaeota archaeon B3_Heim]
MYSFPRLFRQKFLLHDQPVNRFSRKGLHTVTIFGLAKEGTPPHWQTLEDTTEKLSGPKIAK